MRKLARRWRYLVAAALALLVLSTTLLVGSHAQFNATVGNPGTLATAAVQVSATSTGTSVINISNAKSWEFLTYCIPVTYTGNTPATIKMYGTSSGVASSMGIGIVHGTSTDTSTTSCATFTPDSTAYTTGQPPGTLYAGIMNYFPSSYSSGVADPNGLSSSNATEVYEIELAFFDSPTNSSSGSLSFTWEADSQ